MQKTLITPKQAAAYALRHYAIQAEAYPLPGEVDINFCLKTPEGQSFTLKISRPETDEREIDFQTQLLSHLSKKALPFAVPAIAPATSGEAAIRLVDGKGQARWLRLQQWVPGKMLDDVNPRSPTLLESWGQTAGHLVRALADFDHSFAHRFYKWNPSETLYSQKFRIYLKAEKQVEIADYFWQLFEQEALPHLPSLRQSVNYNDAHEHNLLMSEEAENPLVTGVIDFGDALYTHTINELAIACAYACMHKPDPLAAAAHVIRGFHEVYPLEAREVAVLFPLIAARLMITVASAAFNKHQEPDNEYLSISERPAWELLEKLRHISPALAHFTFRHACGWEPCPTRATFDNWLTANKGALGQAVVLAPQKVIDMDLSVGSLELGNNSDFDTISTFNRTIERILEAADARVAIGGYGEIRPFYSTDAYEVIGNNGPQWRTVHLGTDIWAVAGTPVLAPLDGTIHSFQYNDAERDYGPTIILAHQVSEYLTFYTLYGHLGLAALEGIEVGMSVRKGQQIATIGPPPINGNWPPHLHFQVMLDMLGKEGDFPGVAFPESADIWLSICPPLPGLIGELAQNFSHKKESFTLPDILQARQQHLGKSLSISYDTPLHMVRGHMQYLYDATGRRYLDTVNNVPHVGHQHPRVVRAAQRQLAVLNTNTRYLHEQIVLFAEELLATLPDELSVVHFVNSGSEANELALRMTQAYTGQRDMIAVEVGYHGNTGACIDISSYKFDGKGGNGAPPFTQIVPIPDTYRGQYRNPENAGSQYATHVAQAILNLQRQGRNIGGFICESILSCGGQIVLPEGYLSEAYGHVRAAGGLCIADEVQVGFGRVGDAFWGFELQGVVPDIVTMGKPIGNGHPLAAVVTTKAVAEAFANGMEYFNTFGGNPVSCAIGREVLQVIKDEDLQVHAKTMGDYLIEGLLSLKQRYPVIGDIRGHGLFLGIELVQNRETREPAAHQTRYLANRMRTCGILMSTDGPFHNVLKIKPPMCFNHQNAAFLMEYLEQILGEDVMMR